MLVLPLLLCYKNSFFQTSKQQQLGTVCVKSDNEIAILTQTTRFPKLKHFFCAALCS